MRSQEVALFHFCRMKYFYCVGVFLLVCGVLDADPISAWRVENRMGAHQLAVSELCRLVLPMADDD